MIGIKFTGWDGSVWDLRTGAVRLTADGIEGLGNLDFEVFVQDTAMRHGQTMTGWRGKPRDVLLPVMFGPFPSEAEWLRLTRLWWKVMHPQKVSTLTVQAPDGTERNLDVRFVNDGGGISRRDPTRDLLEVFPIRMVADNPWFYGKDFGRSFNPTSGPAAIGNVNFFGGGPVVPGTKGKGTPLVVSAAQRTSRDIYENPGDDDVWPDLIFRDATSRFTATIGTGVVSAVNQPVLDGEVLKIEMSPLRQVALLTKANGTVVNVTKNLSGWGFRPIPALGSTQVKLEVEGTGSYQVVAVPHFFRGW